jgi:6-phospho-3-hexuloisomerase
MGEAAATASRRDADVHALARQALAEVGAVFAALLPGTAERLCDEILDARRIACFGVGREGLMIRALCMRLMHLGFDAHVVGDMTTPPIGPDDLLIVSAGPGGFPLALAILGVARDAGARSLVVTAQPGGPAARQADAVVHLPAQTMADDCGETGTTSILPMGSLFEAAELVFFDLVSILLRDRTGQTPEQMRARHTNLE